MICLVFLAARALIFQREEFFLLLSIFYYQFPPFSFYFLANFLALIFQCSLSLRVATFKNLPSFTLGGAGKPKLLAKASTSMASVLKMNLSMLALKLLRQAPQAQKAALFMSQLLSTSSRSLLLMPTSLFAEQSAIMASVCSPSTFFLTILTYFLFSLISTTMSSALAPPIRSSSCISSNVAGMSINTRTLLPATPGLALRASNVSQWMLVYFKFRMTKSQNAFCLSVAKTARMSWARLWARKNKISLR